MLLVSSVTHWLKVSVSSKGLLISTCKCIRRMLKELRHHSNLQLVFFQLLVRCIHPHSVDCRLLCV